MFTYDVICEGDVVDHAEDLGFSADFAAGYTNVKVVASSKGAAAARVEVVLEVQVFAVIYLTT